MILIKSFEGFRPRAVKGDDGRWVIGYGHRASAREGLTVGEQDAELLLQYDLLPVVKALNEQVAAPLNQHQFDALASFAVSVGVERFLASDVLQRLNSGQAGAAADALIGWPEAPAPDNALRRRAAERALFFADPQAPVHLADLLASPLPPPQLAAPPEQEVEEATGAAADGSAKSGAEPSAPAATPDWAPQDGAFQPPGPTLAHQWFSPYAGVASGPLPGFPGQAAPAEPASPAAKGEQDAEGEPVEPFPAVPQPEGSADLPPAPAFPAVDEPVAAPAPDESLVLTPPAEADFVEGGRETWPEPAPADHQAEELFGEPASAPVLRHEADAAPARRFDWSETGAFLIMGGIGLAACAFAAAAFRKAMTDDSFAGDFTLIGWVLALIGLTCVGVSSWNLYRRWGRRD